MDIPCVKPQNHKNDLLIMVCYIYLCFAAISLYRTNNSDYKNRYILRYQYFISVKNPILPSDSSS